MSDDERLAREFLARRAEAEAYLRREMAKLGLYERDGWRIAETTRERDGGSELVLRPVHNEKVAPEGLECVVHIREVTPKVESHCSPPEKPEGA